MPNCEIISGGVKIAEKMRIPIKKYFLFVFKILVFRIFNFVKIISKIGNWNERPLAKRRNIVNFMYSEYLDSSSKFNPDWKKFSNEIKNDHIRGIKRKNAKITPKKNKIGINMKIGKKKTFSFLYISG